MTGFSNNSARQLAQKTVQEKAAASSSGKFNQSQPSTGSPKVNAKSSTAAPTTANRQTESSFCGSCGTRAESDSLFCGSCGTKI